jgi:sugar phosphate isomerase/epimerase
LLVEPTAAVYADLSKAFTLRDTITLADEAGIGVCIDVAHCWTDPDLRSSIARAGGRVGLVQLADWLPGLRHQFRAVPGDGAIPIERILGWILETGYDGLFDLELHEEPGVPRVATLERALERSTDLLERLGI